MLSGLEVEGRYPTEDSAGVQHLLGGVVLACKHYDLLRSRFYTPDVDYTGFAANGSYYSAGVVVPGHAPYPATWSTEPSGSNRGTQEGFPQQILLVLTETELCILDAEDGTLWMRFLAAAPAAGYGAFFGEVSAAAAADVAFDIDGGVLYLMRRGEVRVADFRLDRMSVWSETAATITAEPSGGGVTGSIRYRNTSGVLDVAGAGGATAMNSAWRLNAAATALLVHPLRQTAARRQLVAVGTALGLMVRTSGLNGVTPAYAITHVGPATGGAVVYGNGAGDEVVDDDGDPTGGVFSADANFAGDVTPGMLLSVNNGSWETPVQISGVDGGRLDLVVEATVGTPTAWRVQANVRALARHDIDGLVLVAGNRVVVCGSAWSDFSGSTTLLLNPSTSLDHNDLPEAVGAVHAVEVLADTILVATDLGLLRSTLTGGGLPLFEALLVGNDSVLPDASYVALGDVPRLTALAVDPGTGFLGMLQTDIAAAEGDVGAGAGVTYAFGAGADLEAVVNGAAATVELVGTLSAAEVVAALEAGLPTTRWTHLGAGRWRVESVGGDITIGEGTANAVLGLTNNTAISPRPGLFREIDLSTLRTTRSLPLPGAALRSQTSEGAFGYVVHTLAAPPAPYTLTLTEPGGQVITDDGAGSFTGDIDPLYVHSVDYTTGEVNTRFASTPTGVVTMQYATGGQGYALVGFRNEGSL